VPSATDILVLGAGPAGSALAAHLARAGFAVTLADRKAFPRPKPCGEFLSPACAPYLAELGVAGDLAAAGMIEVEGMRLHGFGRLALGRFRPVAAAGRRHGFGVRREVLDHLLVQQAIRAGARFLPRTAFGGLLRGADGAVAGAVLRPADGGELPVRARFVVGADGVRSHVARALGVQRRLGWLDRFALTTHFDGVPRLPTAEVHLFDGGYFAATTVDQRRFSLNLLVDRRALRDHDAGGGWDAFVAARLAQAPALAARLAGANRTAPWRGIGPLAFRTTAQAGPGFALCGDACGYVDPLTGEGIYFALFLARELAQALPRALASPACSGAALAAYERARGREIGPRLLLAKALQRGLAHGLVVRGLLALLAARPAVADLLVTMTGDEVHPRDLLRPAFWRAFRGAAVA
jgi:flavin-dependent dehydrogenase